MLEKEIQREIDELNALFQEQPGLDAERNEVCLSRNELTPYPLSSALQVKYWWVTYDYPQELRRLMAIPDADKTVEQKILQSLKYARLPLQALSPVSLCLGTGKGPGTLATAFGMELDPNASNSPVGHLTADEILDMGMPDPRKAGILPEIFEFIEAVKSLTPDCVKIGVPDTQGPYNLAHMMMGDEIFYLPADDPENMDAVMTRITDFYLAFHQELRAAIGEKRYPLGPNARCRLRLCSCNLISMDMYLEHVCKHDQRLAEFFGEIGVHPCGGRHVFLEAIRHIPNIGFIEAVPFDQSPVPCITADEAMEEIGDRPIRLEMSRKATLETVRDMALSDFAITRRHPTFTFYYDVDGMTLEQARELRVWMIDQWTAQGLGR